MFKTTLKKQAIISGAAALALTASASSMAALTLLNNGDFEAGGAGWGVFVDGAGGSTVSYEATGGNGGGFALASNTGGGWGGGFVNFDVPVPLSDFGLAGGDSTTFQWDMKDFNGDGAGVTGIKLESWTAGAVINDTGDIHFAAADSNWNTYSQSYTFDASATHMKVVLVGTNAGEVGFDNVYIDAGVTAVPVPAAAWLFGSALAGLVAVRRNK